MVFLFAIVLSERVALGEIVNRSPRVLILYPYDERLPATAIAGEATRNRLLEATAGKIDLFSEFLDLSRFPEKAHLDRMARYLAEKYVEHRPDVVISEHAVALMLAVAKQLGTWTPEFMRRGGWRGLTHGATLRGATVGILGLGRIGRGVAQRLSGWEARILAYDPFLKEAPPGIELVDFFTLVEQSDFLTLHATPSPDNHHILNAAAFAKMKPSAIVVNTGRGSLIDYTALRAALANGQIAGAALDVFDQEPPKTDDPLFSLPNVLCTPHVAAWTTEGTQAIGWHAAKNLWAMMSGEGQADIVNPQAKQRRSAALLSDV